MVLKNFTGAKNTFRIISWASGMGRWQTASTC